MTRMSALEKRAIKRAVAQVVSIDFAFSAFSLSPYDVTMSIPATIVMAAVASTRILRRVLAIDPPKLCKFCSVVLLADHSDKLILLVLTPPKKSLALKVKSVLIRLSDEVGGGASAAQVQEVHSPTTTTKTSMNRSRQERRL